MGDKNRKRLGTMLDCSRNAVMKPEKVKEWIDITAAAGYNMLLLYTEDTYEIEGHPYFGYLRGRYSRRELKEIDAYGQEKGVEIIPCIQTLAHMATISRWPAYRDHFDVQDIMLAEDEEIYGLIEAAFATISDCFSSHCVHIGMDEANLIGRGQYYDLHGERDKTEVLLKHIKRVSEIGRRHGLTLSMWSDMFYRLAAGDYYVYDVPFQEGVREQIPDNVELTYWDYNNDKFEHYDKMLASHERLKAGTWFAGGLWTWTGFAPHNTFAIRNTGPAVEACRKQNISNVFFTLWGDDGAECSKFAVLPALVYAAERARGNTDEAGIKRRFEELFDVSWEDYMLLDLPDSHNNEEGESLNTEKYLLYQDPFLGILDSTLDGTEGAGFAQCAHRLRKVDRRGRFGYLFETATALCDVLAVKAELGVRTHRAYQSKDAGELAAVLEDYRRLEERLETFYQAFRRQWYLENKGHGFEVQDIRLGGLMRRVRHCREMLEQYAEGSLERIEELEEKQLDFEGCGETFRKKPLRLNLWRENVTANVI